MGTTVTLARVDALSIDVLRRTPDVGKFIESAFRYYEGADPADPFGVLELDKSWRRLGELLAGSAESGATSLSLAIRGGEYVGVGSNDDWELVMYLTPAQVAAVAAALSALDDTDLARRFDPNDVMNKGMRMASNSQEIESEFNWLRSEVDLLRRFYADVARRGAAVISVWV